MTGSPWDDPDMQEFLRDVQETMLPMLEDVAFSLSIVSGGKPDAKFFVELGAALWLDKPLVLLVLPGETIPKQVAKIAYAIIQTDPSTEEGQAESQEQMVEVMKRLVADGVIEPPDDALSG